MQQNIRAYLSNAGQQGSIFGWDLLCTIDDQKLHRGSLGLQFQTELILKRMLPDGERVATLIRLKIQADVVHTIDPGFIHYGNSGATGSRRSCRVVQQRYRQLDSKDAGECG
jgi:hypothetical protein